MWNLRAMIAVDPLAPVGKKVDPGNAVRVLVVLLRA